MMKSLKPLSMMRSPYDFAAEPAVDFAGATPAEDALAAAAGAADVFSATLAGFSEDLSAFSPDFSPDFSPVFLPDPVLDALASALASFR
jgi:hypothetical protein